MSGAIKFYKAQYRGDPGLFDVLGKVVGGIAGVASKVLPGPIGMVASGVSSLLNRPKTASAPVAINVASNGKPLNPSVLKAFPQLPQLQMPTQVDSTRTSGVSLFPGGPMVGTQTTYSSPAGAHPGQGCGSGFHTNKTGYYTRQGYVAPGSKCVRNRKRNPLNPRAASRAMARLSSAKKAARFLGQVSIREKGCGCK